MAYNREDDEQDYAIERYHAEHGDVQGECAECGLRIDDVNVLGVAHDGHGQVFCDTTCKALFHSDDTEEGGF